MLFSIITICKGRLHHLKQTLTRIVLQPNTEVIVVDYDCPDGTAAWVSENYPKVKLVKVSNAPIFLHSHARNVGVKAATGEWLIFVDADLLVDENYIKEVTPFLKVGRYFRPALLQKETWGHVICLKSDFEAIGGFDEVMVGWGGEDDDLFERLDLLGCESDSIPEHLVEPIRHEDTERSKFCDTADPWITHRANALYSHIKFDLMLNGAQMVLPLETRNAIYTEVRRTILEDAKHGLETSQIVIHLPIDKRHVPIRGWNLRRHWIYDLVKIQK